MVDIKENKEVAEITRDYSKNSTMEKIVYAMMTLAAIGLVAAIAAVGYVILTIGADRSEIMECNKLKGQAQSYAQFFMTEWQKEMCDSQGIFIDAPVK